MRTLIAVASAFGLAAAPVAATAGTRAGDVVPAAAKIERDTAPVVGASEFGATSTVVAIVAAIAVILGIIAATDGGGDDGVTEG